MSIQSSINSAIASVYQMKAIGKGLEMMGNQTEIMGKQTQLQEKWFGEKKRSDVAADLTERARNAAHYTSEERRQMAKEKQAQYEYKKSGQAEADAEAMALYEEQAAEKAAEKAAINYTRDTRIENKREQKEKFKERKARILNRHGVIYQEVI